MKSDDNASLFVTLVLLSMVLLCSLMLSNCGSGGGANGGTGGSGSGGTATSSTFVQDPDAGDIMEVPFTYPDGSTHRREVPVNQIMLMFRDTVSASEARGTAASMVRDLAWADLSLVGQIPRLGIYQFEIENPHADPASAIDLLDTVIDALRGYPGVETVSYNELLDERFAENDDDNTEITGYDRAAFSKVDYFQAIPVFDEILDHVTLHNVKVAVVDSGIDLETGQFDEIRSGAGRFEYLDVGFPGTPPMDIHPQKHGTAVAGILAADNGDGVTNGIALRVLGNHLSLFVANCHQAGNFFHMGRAIAGAQIAVERGARIVNLSHGRNDGGGTPPWLIAMQEAFMRLFTAEGSRNVLFVAAASNDRLVLSGNDAPAGLPAPNLITVGGVSSNLFGTRYAQSATGAGIDIAAPATRVPVCCFGNPAIGYFRHYESGNSFAAPIVASIAAIILSVDPSLTGAELKDFLTDGDNTHDAPAEVSGIRPALLKTAGNAILDLGSSSAYVDDVADCMFDFEDDLADPSGHMINRLVGEVDFEVSGPGYYRHHTLGPEDLSYSIDGRNFGIIGGDYVVVNFRNGSEIVNIGIDRNFELGRAFRIPADGDFLVMAGGVGGDYLGGSEAGTVTFTECEVTARSLPLNYFDTGFGLDRFLFIEVAGTLEGGVARGDILSDPPVRDVVYNANGSFTKAFMLLDMDSDTMDYLEEHCEGGYAYTP